MPDEINKPKGWGAKFFSTQNFLIALIALLLILYFAGYLKLDFSPRPQVGMTSHDAGHSENTASTKTEHDKMEKVIWTCAMHPQIRLPKPGNCPICGMKLIPVAKEEVAKDATVTRITLTPGANKLAQIQVTAAKRQYVSLEVRLVGKLDYQEPLVSEIAARVPGRIDKLFVDYTGVAVKKGDHLALLYSPELITAQEELLQTFKVFKQSDKEIVLNTFRATLEAVREKLRLWGLTTEQIQKIEERGKISEHLVIYSPISGVVIGKNVTTGTYVDTGMTIYTVADLSELWIKLDAYESDLPWLHYAQKVEFITEAYPGEVFHGQISFIDPILNPETRTVKLRINVPNQQGKLKPGMFVKAVVKAKMGADGQVADTDLSHKWICPMHPEIIRDESGNCPRCGMPLVKAEDLGYITDTSEITTAPLVIPASAVLITGKRAVVYVEVPDMEKPTYEGREIILGPRAGDVYLVKSGLRDGELVVTQGSFKLDSSLQLQAKPSMMLPEEEIKKTGAPPPPAGHAGH